MQAVRFEQCFGDGIGRVKNLNPKDGISNSNYHDQQE